MDPSWHDRIPSSEFLRDIQGKPLDDVREMRSACGRLEAQLSFARRLVQGRLDIVEAERDRRAAGMPASNLAELVAALPEMLAGKVQGNATGFRSRDIAGNDDPVLEAELDSILDGQSLVSLPASSDAHVSEVAARLAALERTVSDRRRLALEAFDALSAEVIRRFRDGEVSVESVLG
jgi:hypothetical protein